MKSIPEFLLLLLLALVQFTNVLDFIIIMPLNPQMSRAFEMNPSMFSWVVASYALSAAISGFAAAFFLDRYDRKKSLMFTYAGFIVGTFFCSIAPNYWFLVFARIFTGIFGGIMGAQILAIVSDIIPYERRGQAMGIIMASFSVASIVGVPIALFLANNFNWQVPFLAICAIGIPVWILAYFVIPPINSHLKKDRNTTLIFKVIMQNPSQYFALIMRIILMMGHFMIVPNVADFLVTNAGLNEKNLFWVYLVGGAITLITTPLIGRLADKVGKAPVFVIFVLLTFIPVVLITNLGKNELWVVLVVTASFFIFSSGRFTPAQALISETVEPSHRGSFMSILSSMQQLGAGIGAFIAGTILYKTDNGETQNFSLVGIVCILISACSLFFIKKIKPLKRP